MKLYRLFSAFLLVLLFVRFCACALADDTDLSITGLRVARGRWSPEEGWLAEKETSFTLQLIRRDQDIIGLDLEKCELKYFIDDKGSDLLKGDRKPAEGKKNLELDGSRSGDYFLYVRIWGPSLPHPEATKLRAEGKLVLSLGWQKTEVENRGVAVKAGSEINCGATMLKITKTGPPDVERHPWTKNRESTLVRIEGENKANMDKDLQFSDESGNRLSASRVSMSTHGPDNGRISMEYILSGGARKVTVKASYWAEVRQVEIPFKIEMGIGIEEESLK